jgi:hypothetical protein
LRQKLLKQRKTIGLANLGKIVRLYGAKDSDVLFSINKYGFKGPEIAIPKPDSIFRILTLGTLCPWGPYMITTVIRGLWEEH